MTEEKQPTNENQGPLVVGMQCAGCGLNMLELIGFIPTNRELLIKCKSCGMIQGIMLDEKITETTPHLKTTETQRGTYLG